MADIGVKGRTKTAASSGQSDPLEVTATAFTKDATGDASGLDVIVNNPASAPVETASDFRLEDALGFLSNQMTCLIDIIKEQDELLGNKGCIADGSGTKNKARVTTRNQLVTAPLEFSNMFNAQAVAANTAYNVVLPKIGKQFIITDLILYGNKDVDNTNDATVVVYEASAIDSLVVDETIFNNEIPRRGDLPLTGLNIEVSSGAWVNIKTSSETIFINIGGYYVDAV